MKKTQKIYLGLFIGLAVVIIFIAAGNAKSLKNVCAKDFCIQAEVVRTDKARQRGLMFRKSMPQDRGMFFVFEKDALLSFWMKNMRFPLDIIWIGRDKKIVDIYEYALPCKDVCKTIIPAANAQFVLEVNAGFTNRLGIKIGDSLNF